MMERVCRVDILSGKNVGKRRPKYAVSGRCLVGVCIAVRGVQAIPNVGGFSTEGILFCYASLANA
jgi:hypothetical protein